MFLVLRVHFLGGERHRCHRRVEVHAAVGGDFIAGDHEAGPRLDRAKRTSFDARDLHETGDRVARHPEVMLQRRFRGVRHHLMVEVVSLRDERGAHRRGHADFSLTAALGARQRRIVFAQIPNGRGGEESVADLLLRQLAKMDIDELLTQLRQLEFVEKVEVLGSGA